MFIHTVLTTYVVMDSRYVRICVNILPNHHLQIVCRPGRPRTVFGTIRSFSSSGFCLSQLIYIIYIAYPHWGSVCASNRAPQGLRRLCAESLMRAQNRLICVFLTTNSFFARFSSSGSSFISCR